MLTVDEIHNLSNMVGITNVDLVQDMTGLLIRYPDLPDSLIKRFVHDVQTDSQTLSLWIIITFETYDLQSIDDPSSDNKSVEKLLYTIVVDSGIYMGGEPYLDDFDGFVEYLFTRNLQGTKYVACHGDKCRRSVDFVNDGVWCDDCHGEFWKSMPDQVISCLKQDVNFTNIAEADVLYSHVRKTQTDRASLDAFVNSTKIKQQESEFRCKFDRLNFGIQQLESEKHRLLKRSVKWDDLANYRTGREQNKG